MNYFFPVESSKRDIDSRIIIAANILNLQDDSKIFLYYYKKLNEVLKFSNNKESIILDNGPNYYDNFSYASLVIKKIYLSIIDEEGAVLTKHHDYDRTGFNNFFLKKYINIFSWGEVSKKKILKRHQKVFLKNKHNIVVTGNPRFELCKKKYDFFYKKENKNIEKKILINFAFGSSNNLVPFKDECLYWKNRTSTLDDFYKRNLPALDYQNKLIVKFIEGIKFLIKNSKENKFRIRFHPVENPKIYIDNFKKFKNVEIDKKSSIQSAIRKSSLVIHSGCTTALESAIYNLPIIAYIPKVEGEEKNQQYLTLLTGKTVRDKKKLLKIIKREKNSNYDNYKTSKKKLDILSKHIVDFKNNNSSLNIATEMVKNFKKHTIADKLSAYFLYSVYMVYKKIVPFFKIFFKSQAKDQVENANFKKILKMMNKRSKLSFKNMKTKEIYEKFYLMSKILKIDSKEKKFTINKIANNAFIIQNTTPK